jgi:hypothetical protein
MPTKDSLIPNDFTTIVQETLKQWHDPSGESPLRNFRMVRNLLQKKRMPHMAVNQLLLNVINELERTDRDSAILLHLRYLDRMETARIANRLNVSEATYFRKHSQAIELLAKLLWAEEEAAQAEFGAAVEARLELPTYEQLFGVDSYLDQLSALLEADGLPWIVLVQGIGGIGKTVLADAFMRRAIHRLRFDNFGWVTARQSTFKLDGALVPISAQALTAETLLYALAEQILEEVLPLPFSVERVLPLLLAQMKAHPHLVVVDNLETIADVEMLLPTLQRLTNPSKFLLTSRQRLEGEARIFPIQLHPLPEEEALALVRHEARMRNLPTLYEAEEAELRPIYEIVGGNPLALRLVVGQSHCHALHTILSDLHTARGSSVEHLYTYIYRRAWDSLDDNERQLFLTMPLAPVSGADLAFLAMASALDPGDLRDAVETLIRLNLVDHRSNLHESRYTIHSLTRTFLLEQVTLWQ